jgi:hypothetical protein
VAGAAAEDDVNDRFGASRSGASLGAKEVGEGEAGETKAAYAEEVPPADAVVGSGGLSLEDVEHGGTLEGGRRVGMAETITPGRRRQEADTVVGEQGKNDKAHRPGGCFQGASTELGVKLR